MLILTFLTEMSPRTIVISLEKGLGKILNCGSFSSEGTDNNELDDAVHMLGIPHPILLFGAEALSAVAFNALMSCIGFANFLYCHKQATAPAKIGVENE